MRLILLVSIALAAGLISAGSWAANAAVGRSQVEAEALRGFEEVLELWRGENYDELYYRLIPSAGSDIWKFVDLMNHSGRKPACCWEKMQDVKLTYVDQKRVGITAKMGIEVEGVGTRFVTRTFSIVEEEGVWKIPEADIISLAEPNMQRIPREFLERAP